MPNLSEGNTPTAPEPATSATADAVVQSALLFRVTRALTAAPLTIVDRIETLAGLIVPIAADWCVIDLPASPDGIRQVSSVQADPGFDGLLQRLTQQYSPNPLAPFGVADVMWDRQPKLYAELADGEWLDFAVDEVHRRALQDLGLQSVLSVPLIGRDRILGVMSWAMAGSGRRFAAHDLRLAIELAGLAAMAVDHARMFEEAEQSRQRAERTAQRLQRLQSVSDALVQASTADAVCSALADQVCGALHAMSCGVGHLQPYERSPAHMQYRGLAEAAAIELEIPADAESPWRDAIEGGEAVFLEEVSDLRAAYPEVAAVYEGTGIEALAAVPLVADGRIVGIMVIGFARPQVFAEDERDFLHTLAKQGAAALARADLQAAAQQALQGQEYLFTGLAHDLKNPLSVIQMNAYMLETNAPAEAKRAKSIMHASERICALVDTMMDLSSVRHGTLNVVMAAGDLSLLLQTVQEDIALSLEPRDLTLAVTCSETLPDLCFDRHRLHQSLMILLGFAARRAPAGSTVVLSVATSADGWVQVSVGDQGRPIPPEQQSHLNDPCWQPPSGQMPGMGPGLAVVNGIVLAHGGRFGIESHPEIGTVFRFDLPQADRR